MATRASTDAYEQTGPLYTPDEQQEEPRVSTDMYEQTGPLYTPDTAGAPPRDANYPLKFLKAEAARRKPAKSAAATPAAKPVKIVLPKGYSLETPAGKTTPAGQRPTLDKRFTTMLPAPGTAPAPSLDPRFTTTLPTPAPTLDPRFKEMLPTGAVPMSATPPVNVLSRDEQSIRDQIDAESQEAGALAHQFGIGWDDITARLRNLGQHPITGLADFIPITAAMKAAYKQGQRTVDEMRQGATAMHTPGIPTSQKYSSALAHYIQAIPGVGQAMDAATEAYQEAGGQPVSVGEDFSHPSKYLENLKIAANTPKVKGALLGGATQAALNLAGFKSLSDALAGKAAEAEVIPPESTLGAGVKPPQTVEGRAGIQPPPARPNAPQLAAPPPEAMTPEEAALDAAISDQVAQQPQTEAEVTRDLESIAPEDRQAVLEQINQEGIAAYNRGDFAAAVKAKAHADALEKIIKQAALAERAAAVRQMVAERAGKPAPAEPEPAAAPTLFEPPAAAEQPPAAAPEAAPPRTRRGPRPVMTAEPPPQMPLGFGEPEAAAPLAVQEPPAPEATAPTEGINRGDRVRVGKGNPPEYGTVRWVDKGFVGVRTEAGSDVSIAQEYVHPAPAPAAPPPTAPPTAAPEGGLVGAAAEKIGKRKKKAAPTHTKTIETPEGNRYMVFETPPAPEEGSVAGTAAKTGKKKQAASPKPAADGVPSAAELADFFTPGNVIYNRYWGNYDKVLAFKPEDANGSWAVQVIHSDEKGNPTPGERPRWHHTYPEQKKGDKVVSRAPLPPPPAPPAVPVATPAPAAAPTPTAPSPEAPAAAVAPLKAERIAGSKPPTWQIPGTDYTVRLMNDNFDVYRGGSYVSAAPDLQAATAQIQQYMTQPQAPAPAIPATAKPRKRAQAQAAPERAGPYEVLGAEDTQKRAEHYAGGPAEIWRVRTDAGDIDVFVSPGGGRDEAVNEASKIVTQNLGVGVNPERLFNPGTYTGTPAPAGTPAPPEPPLHWSRVAGDSYAEARARDQLENANRATAERSMRHNAPVIAVNDDALVMLSRFGGITGQAHGLTIEGGVADKIIADLRQLTAYDPDNRQGLATLADAMEAHRTPNGNTIFYRSILPDEKTNSVVLEELFHDWQQRHVKKAGAINNAMHAGSSANAWRTVTSNLVKLHGYSPIAAAFETPAWVASGDFHHLGITSDQAVQLLADYFEKARDLGAAVDNLPPIAESLKGKVQDEIRSRNLGKPAKDVSGGSAGRVDPLQSARPGVPEKLPRTRAGKRAAASEPEVPVAQSLAKLKEEAAELNKDWLLGGVRSFAAREGTEFPVTPEVGPDTRAMEIADAYEAMKHEPNNPAVRTAYSALKRDIDKQWNYAQEMGVTFEPWDRPGQPYRNSAEMKADVDDNHHLFFFRGGEMPSDHPLAEIDPETGFNYNEKMRAVHDLYGHAVQGHQFGPKGEENAWLDHSKLFSAEALPAVTTETKGQNSWVNFGPQMRRPDGTLIKKGEPGWLPPESREYAKNKAGLLPQRFYYRPDAPASFVSPSVLTIPSATAAQRQFKSSIHRQFVDQAHQLAKDLGLKVVIESALGSWQGGAENSIAIHYPVGTSPDLVSYLDSNLGRLGHQFAIGRFTPDAAGKDKAYMFWVDGKKAGTDELAQVLLNNGIENSTIVPAEGGYTVTLISTGDALHDNIKKVKSELGVQSVGQANGEAEFPGNYTDRDAAGRDFASTIEEIESRRPSLRGIRRSWESRPNYRILSRAIREAKELEPEPAPLESIRDEAERRKGLTLLEPGADPDQVADNRKNNLNWGDIREYLLPAERKAYEDNPELQRRIVNAVNMMPNVDEWDAATKVGAVGRLWYERSGRAFDALMSAMPELFKKGDKDKFLNFVSALSPVQTVRLNLLMAIDLWDKWNQAGRPEDVEWKNPKTFTGVKDDRAKLYRLMAGLEKEPIPREERGLFGGGRGGPRLRRMRGVDLDSRLYNAIRALQGQPLSGPKVSAFAPNLGKNEDKSTNDTWMAVFADTDPNTINQKHLYDAVSAHVRIAAKKNGISTRQAQAAIWSFIKALAEMSGWGGGRWIPPQVILDAGLVTPDAVEAHSQDFADLMLSDPGIRDKLARIGVDLNVLDRKIEGRVPGKPAVDEGADKGLTQRLSGAARRLETARANERIRGHLERKTEGRQGSLLPQLEEIDSPPRQPMSLEELRAELAAREPESLQRVEYSEPNPEYTSQSTASKYRGRITVNRQGRPTLWLSREFTDLFQETAGTYKGKLLGQNLSKAEIDKKLQSIDRWLAPDSYASPERKAKIQQLKNLLLEAKGRAGPEGVMLATLEGAGPKEWLKAKETSYEEGAHGWQRALLGQDVSDADFIQHHLDTPQINSLLKSMPKGMVDHLDTNYSRATSGLRVIEAGAKFLSQNPKKFGVSWYDAAKWLIDYILVIMDKYGEDAILRMPAASNVSKFVKKQFREEPHGER